MKKTGIIVIAVVVLLAIFCISSYNSMVSQDEAVGTAWSNVENQYQRRADLIPNLVNTVKGYAAHEKETFDAVVSARAKATQTTVSIDDLTPEKMAAYQRAQGEIGSALSRLLAVTENYPELKANENFQTLQAQLEGTENRISVERRKFNEVAKAYNTSIRRFPRNILAGMFGFEKRPYFEAQEGAEKAPEVKDAIADDVQIMETEVKETEIKRPEIIPGEEILPDVDIPLVISNLTNADYDVQAQQMEEIARISLDNPENAVPYIVREVFSSLIDITKKDTANLAAPTDEQVQARKKLISNFIVMENAKQGQGQVKLPYQLTEKDFALANELSPMEQAERNKEYALYTISILAKIYTDEVEKQTGNIVPLTDLPGSAAIVDALRFNPNSGVKIAAIDALRHIQRPEYKEELTTLYTLAQADSNPQVSMAAERALNRSNV